MEALAAGIFNNKRVHILKEVDCVDGSTLMPTEEWDLFSYDATSETYLALEVDGAGIDLEVKESALAGRVRIIKQDD